MNVTTAQSAHHRPRIAGTRRPTLPVLLALVVSLVAGVLAWAASQIADVPDRALVIGTIVVASLIGWSTTDRRSVR